MNRNIISKTLVLLCLAGSIQAKAAGAWTKIEERSELSAMGDAQDLCASSAALVTQKYLYFFCEPTVKTNYKRIAWTEVHDEKVLSGVVRSAHSSSSSYSESFVGSITTAVATIFEQFSFSMSSKSSSYNETPVYSDTKKRVEMYADEKIQSYGYILWAQQEIVPNKGAESELYNSADKNIKFVDFGKALEACTLFHSKLLTYDYAGNCEVQPTDDSQFTFKFVGKKTYSLK